MFKDFEQIYIDNLKSIVFSLRVSYEQNRIWCGKMLWSYNI